VRPWQEVTRVAPVAVLSLAAAFANFLAGVMMARSLGPGGRGAVAMIVTVSGLVAVGSALGTNVAVKARIPRGLVTLRAYARVTLLLLGVVALPALLIAALVLGTLVDEGFRDGGVVAALTAYGVVSMLWFQAKEGMDASGRIRGAAAVNAAGSWVLVVLVGLAALLAPGRPLPVVLAYIVMAASQAVAAVAILWRPLGERSVGGRQLLAAGPPYLGYHFGQDLAFRLDRPLLGSFASVTAVGHFAVGASLAEIFRLPILASGQFVLYETARGHASRRDVARRTVLWGAVTVGAALGMVGIAGWLVPALYGPGFVEAVAPFRILMIAQIAVVPFLVLSRALVGYGRRWSASVPSLTGVGVLLVSAPLLMPRWGATGAALACVMTYVAMSLAAWVLFTRQRAREPQP